MLAGIDVACFDVRPMRVHTLRLPFDITIALPGSKSVALRAIVAACLAEGRTTIVDATPCDDVLALVDGLAKLGFRIRWFAQDDGILDIEGGLPEGDGSATALIDCGAGGAPLRFLSAVATLCPGTWTLTGNARLQQRPIAALCDALRQLGAQLDDTDGHAPLTIRGGGMHGGPVALDASTSSQHLSALLLIGSLLGSGIESGIESGLDIELTGPLVSAGYADLTARVLSDFGARIDVRGKRWSIAPRTLRSPGDLRIEGDWSAAGAFLVLARITRSRFRGPRRCSRARGSTAPRAAPCSTPRCVRRAARASPSTASTWCPRSTPCSIAARPSPMRCAAVPGAATPARASATW